MTHQQIQLLHTLSKKEERQSYVEWTIHGIDDKAIIELQDLDLLFVSIGEGFIGGLKMLSLTAKGQDFIKDYCDVCECMPCDCGYGS
tara:strand:+ start:5489 stop:5749 length:261 start_codon:yes stop_codon:yes gene_type:complete